MECATANLGFKDARRGKRRDQQYSLTNADQAASES
jgi:hypothetical protein